MRPSRCSSRFDGTLMSYDQELSDDVRDAVADLRAAGHHVARRSRSSR